MLFSSAQSNVDLAPTTARCHADNASILPCLRLPQLDSSLYLDAQSP